MTYGNIGGIARTSSSTVSTTGKVLFASSTDTVNAVMLQNHSETKALLVSLTHNFSTAPTISTTQHTFRLGPLQTGLIRLNKGVAVWVLSQDTTTINYTATELLS